MVSILTSIDFVYQISSGTQMNFADRPVFVIVTVVILRAPTRQALHSNTVATDVLRLFRGT